MDVIHNFMKLSIYFLAAPLQALRVLAHLQTRYSNTTCVTCLTWAIENLSILEHLSSLRSCRHVSTLRNSYYAICNKSLSCFLVDFVLSSTWGSDVCLLKPRLCTLYILATILLCIFLDTSALNVLQFHDVSQLLFVDSVWIVDVAIRV